MKKYIFGIVAIILLSSVFGYFYKTEVSIGAPQIQYSRTILPSTDSLYDIGSNTIRWATGYFDNATTTALSITGLDCTGNANGGALTTDANGNVSCSDDDGGSGDVFSWDIQSWGVSTSTTLGFLNGFLSTASSTISGILHATGGIVGDLTGNADTATALTANGANCSSGNYPLGVDASGAVEGCTADSDTTYLGGTNLTLSGTTFNVDDAFLLNTGDIGTGVFDFGGATSFEIVNNGTVNANGEITTDDTSGQLRYYAGSAERVLPSYDSPGIAYATSTAWTGTTTIALPSSFDSQTFVKAQCYTSAGTLDVVLNDGTNNADLFNASTTQGIITYTVNNTFTAGEKRYLDIGNPATAPTEISCSFLKTTTKD